MSSNNGCRRFARATKTALMLALLGLASPPLLSAKAQAAPTAQVVLLGGMTAGLYQGSGANASTAIVVYHETSNFIAASPCVDLNERGFTALCGKSQYDQDGDVTWDKLATDVGAAVKYLRALPGIQHVVLVGWSGGGAIMAYYQNVAENGLAACQAPERLDPCSDSLAGLPKADGVVLMDGIPGIAFSNMTNWDASVKDPQGLSGRYDPKLYLFNPANGWNSNQLQSSTYSPQFIARYVAGEGARENALVSMALRLQKQADAGNAGFTDTTPFSVGRDNARIWSQDTSLFAHTQGAYPLIMPQYPNGSPPMVINSVRVPAAAGSLNSTPAGNNSWGGGKGAYSAKTFLSVSAIRAPHLQITADSVDGVDWASSNTATPNNVAGIHAPLLIESNTAHYWLVTSELYYKLATKSSSKTLVYVYGALHGFTPCTVCTSMPYGPYGDTEKETFDYVGNWLQTHFGS